MKVTYEEYLQLIANTANNEKEGCPVTKTLDIIQGKWVEHILFFLCRNGTSRFGEIHKAHPQISKTMLSSVLKHLEATGLLVRRQYNEIPPHTEYELTDKGKDLMPVFYAMYQWGNKYLIKE